MTCEVVVITDEGGQGAIEATTLGGTKVLLPISKGYGGAPVDGLRQAAGEHLLTLDADLWHTPAFVKDMAEMREAANFTVASRHAPGPRATKPRLHFSLGRALGSVFSYVLSIPLSAALRPLRTSIASNLGTQGSDCINHNLSTLDQK